MCKITSGAILLLLGICSLCDVKRKQIPILYLIMMSVLALLSFFCKDGNALYKLAGALVGVLVLVASKITKEAIGYGDGWMILNLGIWLGVYRLMQMLFWSGLAAGMYALLFLWRKGWKRSETIPFVPFLAVACVGVLLT